MVRRYAKRSRNGRRLSTSVPVSMRGMGPRKRKARAAGLRRGPAGVSKRRRVVRRGRRGAGRRGTGNVSELNQFTRTKRVTGRFKRTAVLNRTLLKSNQESFIYSFRGVKVFDDNGFFTAHHTVNGGVRIMPVYCMLLNGVNRDNTLSNVKTQPLMRLMCDAGGAANDGKLYWQTMAGLDAAGNTSLDLQQMYQVNGGRDIGSRSMLRYTHVKLNLWGAKQKAIRWTVQVVKISDESCNPFCVGPNTNMSNDGFEVWSELIKQYTFNPISKIDYNIGKRVKVLKTFDTIIQPSATIDGDSDPQVKVLEWFMKWDRLTKYDQEVNTSSGVPQDDANFATAAQSNYVQRPADTKPAAKSQLLLLIRASDFANRTTTFDNTVSGSFDLEFKSKFVELN